MGECLIVWTFARCPPDRSPQITGSLSLTMLSSLPAPIGQIWKKPSFRSHLRLFYLIGANPAYFTYDFNLTHTSAKSAHNCRFSKLVRARKYTKWCNFLFGDRLSVHSQGSWSQHVNYITDFQHPIRFLCLLEAAFTFKPNSKNRTERSPLCRYVCMIYRTFGEDKFWVH